MQVVKIILVVVQFILCMAVTILAMMQSKDDAGMSSTITGSSTNNFFEKNKGRTREGMLKRWTIILGIAFVIITIATSVIYIA
jgi:preprotein translocase subunit SecG